GRPGAWASWRGRAPSSRSSAPSSRNSRPKGRSRTRRYGRRWTRSGRITSTSSTPATPLPAASSTRSSSLRRPARCWALRSGPPSTTPARTSGRSGSRRRSSIDTRPAGGPAGCLRPASTRWTGGERRAGTGGDFESHWGGAGPFGWRARFGVRGMTRSDTIRIASGQGFWGDLLTAPVEQVRRGQVDYLMLDYLAEVTMSIMQKQRSRDPSQGYARDFIPLMGEILPDCVERGVRVVANAGGVNLEACRDAVLEEARKAGLAGRVRVGTV